MLSQTWAEMSNQTGNPLRVEIGRRLEDHRNLENFVAISVDVPLHLYIGDRGAGQTVADNVLQ